MRTFSDPADAHALAPPRRGRREIRRRHRAKMALAFASVVAIFARIGTDVL